MPEEKLTANGAVNKRIWELDTIKGLFILLVIDVLQIVLGCFFSCKSRPRVPEFGNEQNCQSNAGCCSHCPTNPASALLRSQADSLRARFFHFGQLLHDALCQVVEITFRHAHGLTALLGMDIKCFHCLMVLLMF